MRINKNGFTLIELIIVVIIIGILAAIAAPMMQGMKAKAICAEAVTAMGTIRNALRAYYTEHGEFPPSFEYGGLASDIEVIGIAADSLTGTYFGKECYMVFANTASMDYAAIYAAPDPQDHWESLPSSAPRHLEAEAIRNTDQGGWLTMYYTTGKIRQTDMQKSGYLEDTGP